MPANLTPEYLKAEQEYRAASDPEEKAACLQRMLSVIPKHKGTEHMQGDLKRRLSQLKTALARQRRKKGLSYRVKPEGAGQIALAGPPNSGKSSLLAAMTRAEPVIAPWPCSTREPVPGMAVHEKAQIQLVDLPPVWREHCESFVFDNIKSADGALLVIGLDAADPAAELRLTLDLLKEKRVALAPARLDDECPPSSRDTLETILVLTKADLDPDGRKAARAASALPAPLPVRAVSAATRSGLDRLAADVFKMLHVIRVFSKQPGRPPDGDSPYTVPVGTTVTRFAMHVHKDFADNFKQARVWGSAKFDGQVVQRDHVLRDGDVVELQM